MPLLVPFFTGGWWRKAGGNSRYFLTVVSSTVSLSSEMIRVSFISIPVYYNIWNFWSSRAKRLLLVKRDWEVVCVSVHHIVGVRRNSLVTVNVDVVFC